MRLASVFFSAAIVAVFDFYFCVYLNCKTIDKMPVTGFSSVIKALALELIMM